MARTKKKRSYRKGKSLKGGIGKKRRGKMLPGTQILIDDPKEQPQTIDEALDNPIAVIEKVVGGGRRKKKTRKKRGKGGVFSCPGCGNKKNKKQERDFYTVIDNKGNKKKVYFSDDDSYDSYDSDEDLKPMSYYEKEAREIEPNKRPVSPLLSDAEQNETRLSPTFGQFAEIGTYKGGKRRKKKTRKQRGGVKRWRREPQEYTTKDDMGYFYDCQPTMDNPSNKSKYRENMIITGDRDGNELMLPDEWKIIRMNDSQFYDPQLQLVDMRLPEDERELDENIINRRAQSLCNRGYKPLKRNDAKTGAGRKKKTRKKRGGEKSKKIKKLTKIFQQYPKIFPSGYFRFLAARLENHINKNTLWYRNGVVLTWIQYKKTVKKNDKCIIKPGDVKLDQIVNKNQGNGAAKKVVMQFLKKFEKNRIWLEVRANNKRAIRFYRKNGFKKVCNINFGEIPGIMMVKN